MSEYIHKSHNVSVLMYHFVCPAKYRKSVLSNEVDETLKDVCVEISKRYEEVTIRNYVKKQGVEEQGNRISRCLDGNTEAYQGFPFLPPAKVQCFST
nr:transposase [Cohnella silvisoli]